MWEQPADIALFEKEGKDEFEDPTTCTTALVVNETGDDLVEWSEGNHIAKKLAKLRRLRSEAAALALAPAVFHVSREITNTERARPQKGQQGEPCQCCVSPGLAFGSSQSKGAPKQERRQCT